MCNRCGDLIVKALNERKKVYSKEEKEEVLKKILDEAFGDIEKEKTKNIRKDND